MQVKGKNGTQSAKANAKTEKAAFCFAFLDALKRHPGMKSTDALAALHFIGLVGDELTFFMSAKHLGELIRKAESTAEASLWRFRRNGFLNHVLEADAANGLQARPNGGKLANTYRMEIPKAVSPGKSVETVDEVSPEKTGYTQTRKMDQSPEKSGRQSPEKSGTITREKTLDGAGARLRAPQAPAVAPVTSVVLIDAEDTNTLAHQDRAPSAHGAPVGAPASDIAFPYIASPLETAFDPDLRDRPIAPVAEADAPWPGNDEREAEVRVYEGQPATQADLDALAEEEAEAARRAKIKAGGGWNDSFLDDEPAEPHQAEMEARRSRGLSQIATAYGSSAPEGLTDSELAEMFIERHIDGAPVAGWPDVVLRLAEAGDAERLARGDFSAEVWRRTVIAGLASYAEGVGASRQSIERATAALEAELDSVANFWGVARG